MTHNSEAIRLAEASDWKGLLRLIELAPELARESGDYGMLPIHWACTEAQVPAALLDRLLAAFPDGARVKNAVHLLPLHIAIRARMEPHLLRRLLAANPRAARVRTPDGLSTLKLAKQVGGLSDEGVRLLLDAYHESSPELEGDEQEDEDDEEERTEDRKGARSGFERRRRHRDAARSENNRDEGDDEDSDNNSKSGGDDDGGSRSTRQGYELPSKKEQQASPMVVGAPDRFALLRSHDESDLDAFLDDDHGWLSTPHAADGAASPLRRSLSLLSDEGTVESPHDGHLVSPSSTSTSSRARSTSSANSAPLPLTTSVAPPLHKQMQGPFQRKHSLDYHHAAAAAAAATRQSQENLARRSRTQLQTRSGVPTPAQLGGRHQSLPVIPTFEDFRVARPPPPPTATGARYQQQPQHRDVYHDRSSGEDEHDGSGRFQRLRHRSGRDADNGSGDDDFAFDASGHHQPHHQQQPQRRHHHFESPPAWKRDDECSICHANFGMFKHRHHCRNCGKSICSQHSADRKVAMAAKGFKTPQRVCVTCFAMLAHQQSRSKSEFDAVLDAAGLGGPNPVAAFAMQQLHHQQQQHHYALGTQALRSPQFASPVGNGGSPTGARGSSLYPPPLADAAALRKEFVLQSHVSELRHVVAAQQKQLEALAQHNIQMQQQVLEQEELKAETMLLITQLMTRVSVLELSKHERQQQEEDEDDDGSTDAAAGDDSE